MSEGKMLVASGSELVHNMYNLTLSRYVTKGCKIIHANNAMETQVRVNRESDITLLIIDSPLKDTSIPEFLEFNKNLFLTKRMNIILVSSVLKEVEILTSLKFKNLVCLPKPVHTLSLHRAIEKLFSPAQKTENSSFSSFSVQPAL